MLPLIAATALASAATSSPANQSQALEICRPRLAARTQGDISQVSVDSSSTTGPWTVIHGPVRTLSGMGAPAPGMVSAPHVIRHDYNFTCWVKGGRVRKLTLVQHN